MAKAESISDTITVEGGRTIIVYNYPPAMMSPEAAARYCSASLAQWGRWTAAGKNPEPVVLDKRPRWPRVVLDLWVRLGCPERAEFVRKAGATRPGGTDAQEA
jgi:hypothetical protein